MPAKSWWLGCAALGLLLWGCANPGGGERPAPRPVADLNPVSLRGGLSGQELGLRPAAAWVSSREQFASLLAKLGRYSAKAGLKAFPEMDFNRSGVLAVWMGEKPTGGYVLELIPEQSHLQDDAAVVAVRWVEPGKGAMVPQIITHPYLLIRLNKGYYRRIAVVDQHGTMRAQLNLAQ